MNATEVSSATTAVTIDSEQGDQFHERKERYNGAQRGVRPMVRDRYNGARNPVLEERSVDWNKAEATNDQVTVVPETPYRKVRRASK